MTRRLAALPRELPRHLARATGRRLAGFWTDRSGSYSIESILVLPMLAWALLACFSYFDGLRQANVSIKAAHTMSDLLSRETDTVDRTYMEGMEKVLNFLVRSPNPVRMRVTVLSYDGSDERFEFQWSYASGTATALTAGNFDSIVPGIPKTAGGDQVIVVETWMDYQAPFVMGLSDTEISNFVVTRPRFVPQLKWDASNSPTS